jgi:16S rRNA (uracil1498-N3)-methyltransferase
MKYLFVPDSIAADGRVTLTGEQYHYLTKVLRVRRGRRLVGRDGNGVLYDLVVERVDGRACTVRGELRSKVVSELPELILYQGLPKGRKMDTIIRQAVEIGTTRIVPVACERSVPEYEDAGRKLNRWNRIVREACQQSGSAVVAEVCEPIRFEEMMCHPPDGSIRLVFHEGEGDEAVLDPRSLHEYLSENPKRTVILVGPEGGFSPREIRILLREGYKPVRLRTNVLRTETAAIYALSAVQVILTERESWQSKDPYARHG